MKILTILVLCLALAGCATRQAYNVPESQVRAMAKAPEGAEYVGRVETTIDNFDSDSVKKAVEHLRRLTMAKGGNILVLDDKNGQIRKHQEKTSATLYGNAYYFIPGMPASR